MTSFSSFDCSLYDPGFARNCGDELILIPRRGLYELNVLRGI